MKTYQKLFFSLVAVSMLALALATPALIHAQQATNPPGGGTADNPPASQNSSQTNIEIGNPFKLGGNLYDALDQVLKKAILPVGGIVVVIMIIYSGFLFVTARGNEEKLSVAKRSFFYAAIGAAILLGAVAIETGIKATIDALRS